MARASNKLSAVEVKSIDQKGMYHDGGGLYLQVSAGGAKSWIFRFMLDGRSREMGLGPVHAIPLADARKRAAECRRMRFDGVDPIEVRRAEREQKKLDAAKSMTFDACAAAYIDAHKAGWRNAKHSDQWSKTLGTYAGPVFGSLPVQAVDVGLLMKALEPIWQTKPETASRLRDGSRRFSIGPRFGVTERATTRRVGAVISTSCSRRAARFAKSSTTPRCPMTNSPNLSWRCAASKASRRGRWSS